MRIPFQPTLTWGLLLTLLLGGTGFIFAQQASYFDQRVKIPYRLQLGSTNIEPGDYRIEIILDTHARPALILKSIKKAVLARVTGQETENVPEKDRNLGRGKTRLQVIPIPDPKAPAGRQIVFVFDRRPELGTKWFRWTFRIPEAAKTEK